jgi:hypothetical protein
MACWKSGEVGFTLTISREVCTSVAQRKNAGVTDSIRRAARGLQEAHARWEPSTRLSREVDEVLIKTTEVLWWFRSLDELLGEQHREQYQRDLAADPSMALLLKGLQHARNRLGHRMARAIQVRRGIVFPIVFPTILSELWWMPASELDRYRYDRDPAPADAEAAYHVALEGKLVRTTLGSAAAWLLARPQVAPLPDQEP